MATVTTRVSPGIILQTIDESKRVLDRLDKKEKRILIRTGFYGRQVMRRLIRRSTLRRSRTGRTLGASRRGAPPKAHAPGNSGLKDVRIAFKTRGRLSSNYSPEVLIGHSKYKQQSHSSGTTQYATSSHKPVPQLLNEGGSMTMHIDTPTSSESYPARMGERPFRDRAYEPTLEFFKRLLRQERL